MEEPLKYLIVYAWDSSPSNPFLRRRNYIVFPTTAWTAAYYWFDELCTRSCRKPCLGQPFKTKHSFWKKTTTTTISLSTRHRAFPRAMQFIEIAYVSSIREISIVLGTLLSFYLLKESDARKRVMPSIIICTGITILYFQIT